MWYAPYLAISVQRLINRRIQWIIVDSRVYDVSKFADLHPGGAAVLLVDSIGINPFPHHSIKAKVFTESMSLKQRGKMRPKHSSVCIGRKCFTVLSTRACRLALSKARYRKSSRSRRTHFPKYPMRSRHGSRLASPVRIITRVTGASSGLCANLSTRLSCPTRSLVRTTESVSPSTLLISLREFGAGL